MKHTVFTATMDGLTVERAIRDSEFNMGNKHWHNECEIQYILEGTRHFFIDDKTHKAQAGSVSIINSNQIHQTTSDKEVYHDRILLLVDKEKFAKISHTLGIELDDFFEKNIGVIEIPEKRRQYIETLLSDMAGEINRKEGGYQIIIQLRLMELLTYLIRLKENGKRRQRVVAGMEGSRVVFEVIDYINENCADAKSLDDIAKKFFIDKYYLSRIFKKGTGFTVNEFINIQKIRKAQKLLEDTSFSIAKIATLVGYDNITYFTKIFKKYVESTPLKYRKKKIAYKESIRDKSGL